MSIVEGFLRGFGIGPQPRCREKGSTIITTTGNGHAIGVEVLMSRV